MDRTDASQLKTKIKDTAFTGFEGNEPHFEHLPLARWPLTWAKFSTSTSVCVAYR